MEGCAPDQEIHLICDNLSAHKTQQVDTFLAAHPNVRLHFTPTYSSWLNQVELLFSKLQRDVTAGGIFTSVPDLPRKLRHYSNGPFEKRTTHPMEIFQSAPSNPPCLHFLYDTPLGTTR